MQAMAAIVRGVALDLVGERVFLAVLEIELREERLHVPVLRPGMRDVEQDAAVGFGHFALALLELLEPPGARLWPGPCPSAGFRLVGRQGGQRANKQDCPGGDH